jgi:hypothetical protein
VQQNQAAMGFMSKMTFKQKTAKDVTALPAMTGSTGVGPKISYTPTKPVLPIETSLAGQDEPTLFTTFMVLYLGFFGLTLVFYPYIHAADAAPWNPLAYWKTIDAELAFAFRIAGAGFLTLALGPFFDELFGGVGVRMKAFTEQCMMINIIIFGVFAYYSFYAPLSNAISFMWLFQAYFSAFLVGWGVINAVTMQVIVDAYVTFCVFLYASFAVTLCIDPELFWGPPSPVAYWKWDEFSILAGRSFGVSMGILIILGALWNASSGFCKQITLFNAINTGLFAIPTFYGGASAIKQMWEIQFAISIPILMVGLYLEIAGISGAWSMGAITCTTPVDTFNVFNLFWFLPFVAGFLSPYANMLFGPNSISGYGMFTSELGETSLWICKAWAVSTFLIVLGPFLFNLDPPKVAKQMVLNYLATAGIFTYGLLQTDLFNDVTMYPLTGLSVVFAGWGIYVLASGKRDNLPLYMA